MQKKSTIIIFLIIFFLAVPSFSQGGLQRATTTQIAWPNSPMGTSIGPETQFHELIQYLYEWGISLGGIAVFIMLVWAGIGYLTSAGDPEKMRVATNKIRSSILGLVLLLVSWLILNTINPELVQLRRLPTIRDERGFLGLEMDPVPKSAPPCDFVVIYPEIGWRGESGPPIEFRYPALRDKDNFEIIKIEGEESLNRYARPSWESARGFIRLTEEEIDNLNEGIINITRYNGAGEVDEGGQYKEGGICSIAVFFTTSGWLGFGSNVCGGRLAVSNLPVRNFNEIKFREEVATCAEVSRTVPMAPADAPL